MSLDINSFTSINTDIEEVIIDEQSVIRVVKNKKLMNFDENTYAKLIYSSFQNGIIEVQLYSKLLPDAPDFARGFIGIAFRIDENDSEFESFYLRPTNGRTTDKVRKNRAVQYFSYPDYTFEYFRQNNITDFEGPASISLNEWISLKAVINNDKAKFYLNGSVEPVLVVNGLKHGKNARGSVGLFVDVGTEGFFKNLKIHTFD